MNKKTNYGKNPPRGEAMRRRPMDKDSGEQTVDGIIHAGAISLTLIFLEIVYRFAVGGSIESSFFVYITLFSLSAGIVMSLISSFFSEKVNHIICSSMLVFVTVYFCVQLVYVDFFRVNFSWQQMFAAGTDVTAFWREALACILGRVYWILLMFLPTVLYIAFGRKFVPAVKTENVFKGAVGVLAAVMFFAGVSFVNIHSDAFDDKYYYNNGFSATEGVNRFGVLSSLRLDTLYTIFGMPEFESSYNDGPTVTAPEGGWEDFLKEETTLPPKVTVTDAEGNVSVIEPPPIDTSPNVMDIDFDKLIANSSGELKAAHEWFSQREPTNKNAYTGMFKGKNLICITVEGWAPAAINEKLTPTLYKMKNEGFVFENYYCSNWGGSTATGEYAVMTGNYYSSAACLEMSSSKYMPFVLGNMMKNVGYKTDAFHNHTYTYYKRHLSHPNFGYGWHAVDDKGKPFNWSGASFKNSWPRSDRELAVNSLSYITADKPFHLYYMTVSGHAFHTGNVQANKHKPDVKSLNLGYTTNGAICYLAAQYEVELMVQELCAELERKGELENTVFVMAPDHYPYNIAGKVVNGQSVNDEEKTKAALSELYGLPTENIFTNFELYRAPLIIWSASMKNPVKVDKVCSAIDVLPTVLNLFGATYDSRLIMGRDILSSSDGFVVLNCSSEKAIAGADNNWITEFGSYRTATKTFVRNPKYTQEQINKLLDQGYIKYYNALLEKMNNYSRYILEKDYYRKVFGK